VFLNRNNRPKSIYATVFNTCVTVLAPPTPILHPTYPHCIRIRSIDRLFVYVCGADSQQMVQATHCASQSNGVASVPDDVCGRVRRPASGVLRVPARLGAVLQPIDAQCIAWSQRDAGCRRCNRRVACQRCDQQMHRTLQCDESYRVREKHRIQGAQMVFAVSCTMD
jgi:hypothetical protein